MNTRNEKGISATSSARLFTKHATTLLIAALVFASAIPASAQSHQGSLYSNDGLQMPGKVEQFDIAVPPTGRTYGLPANSTMIHHWGNEILVAFRDYSYKWKGYWQHTMFSDAVDTNDCRNTFARSTTA